MNYQLKKRIDNILLFGVSIINRIIPKKQNRVFFYSSPDFSDNARAIYEEFVRNGLESSFDVVWAVKDVDKYKSILDDVTVVKHRSIKNLWYYCRSHYLIRTHSLWGNRYNVKRQIMCVAWHGMPLKKLVRPNDSVKPIECNYILSTSSAFDEELSATMGVPLRKCCHTGMPRNDALFSSEKELELLYPGYKKRIIWMPTFRSTETYIDGTDSEFGIPLVNQDTVAVLNEELNRLNYLLIVKLHPWCKIDTLDNSFSNIVRLDDSDISEQCSLYTYLGQTDALITDYSSVYIDYLLIDKPICFVFDDIDEYKKNRGFVFEPVEDYMPGPIINSFDGLINWIDFGINKDDFVDQRFELKQLFHENCDNYSSQRVLKLLHLI